MGNATKLTPNAGPWLTGPRWRTAFMTALAALVSLCIAAYVIYDQFGIFNGLYGFIDTTGELVIKPTFEKVRPFHDGIAAAADEITPEDGCMDCGRWGYIDKDGNWLAQPRYEIVWMYFLDGGAVKRDGKWGFVDHEGREFIPPQYDGAASFVQGIAPVNVGGTSNGVSVVRGKWGLVNERNEWIAEPKFDNKPWFRDVHEGLAPVRIGGRWEGRTTIGGKMGFIDRTGTWKIEPRFDDASDFRFGLAPVAIGIDWEQYPRSTGKWGLIGRDGDLVFDYQYDGAPMVYNRFIVIRKNGRYGLIDHDGNVVVEPQYEEVDVRTKRGTREPKLFRFFTYADRIFFSRKIKEERYLDPYGNVVDSPEDAGALDRHDQTGALAQSQYGPYTYLPDASRAPWLLRYTTSIGTFSDGMAPVQFPTLDRLF